MITQRSSTGSELLIRSEVAKPLNGRPTHSAIGANNSLDCLGFDRMATTVFQIIEAMAGPGAHRQGWLDTSLASLSPLRIGNQSFAVGSSLQHIALEQPLAQHLRCREASRRQSHRHRHRLAIASVFESVRSLQPRLNVPQSARCL